MVNFRTFETNENTGRYSYKTLRNLSDKLCKEYMLSVIEQSGNSEKGMGYFENIQGLKGNSWKSKLKIIINAIVFQSENFDDFLQKCRAAGVDIYYRPENKIRLKYRLPGMEKWARANTLGPPYDVEGITERIQKYKAFFNGENIKTPRISLINTDNEYFENHEYLKLWAKLKNAKTVAELMVFAESKGCGNIAEIAHKIKEKQAERQSLITEKNELKNKIAEFKLLAKVVKDYKKFKPFKTERDRLKDGMFGTKKSRDYAILHAKELEKFNSALEILSGYQFQNNKLPDLDLLLENIMRLENNLNQKENEVKNIADQIGELSAMQRAFKEYLHIENPEKRHEERSRRSDVRTDERNPERDEEEREEIE